VSAEVFEDILKLVGEAGKHDEQLKLAELAQ
jgi:hypothetical protein